ncbi:UNVERIFIED_CONTAM: hypothetical protein GTU68_055475 [Idotea baltica]|nr:hypothetical protein [Idotea baltica]
MAQHLHAITLVVPDYDEAIEFYVGKLGFRLSADHVLSSDKRWVLVTPPGGDAGHLLLAKADGAEQRAAIGQQTGGRVGFFLHTDCFDKDYARMKAAGVHFEEYPRSEPYGQVVVWKDPFGNRWDLLQLK